MTDDPLDAAIAEYLNATRRLLMAFADAARRAQSKGADSLAMPSPGASVPLTVQAVAARLGVHPNTVYRGVASGEIPSSRVRGAIRIPSAWVDLVAAEGGTEAAARRFKRERGR